MFAVSLRKEILEQWRSRRLLIVTVVFVLFGLCRRCCQPHPSVPTVAAPGDQIAAGSTSYCDRRGGAVRQEPEPVRLYPGVLLAMGMVAQEKERGQQRSSWSPMPRWAFLLGKFAAVGSLSWWQRAGRAGAYYIP